MAKIIFQTEGTLEVSKEDGDCAMIAENLPIDTENSDDDTGMFVKIQSWDESGKHTDMEKLVGKKVRVTIEIIK